MRYLKTYKLFENNVTDDFLLDLNDLLVDVKDQDLHIRYLSGGHYSYPVHQMVGNVKNDRIKLQITKSPTGSLVGKFEITQEVADSLERISEYVSKLGWSFCTFEIHLSGDEWYQLGGGDIKHYIGTEVWYIDITITDYRGPDWYKMRYGTNESVSEDIQLHKDAHGDIESYLSDIEDYGWGYMVNRSTRKMMPSNGKVNYIISIDIWRKNSETIDIDIIKERINQISDLIKPFEQKEAQIKPKYLYRISMPKSFKYDNLNDYSVTELLTDEGEKHTYLRDGVFREIIDDAEFHVKDWGMDRWLDDMQCVGSPTIDSDEIVFISTKQFDDFKVNIPIEDLEHDVRLVIDNIQIKFIYETKE